MRLSYFFIIFSLLFFSQTAFAISETLISADCNIAIKLKIGSKGADVECLQKKIGVVADGSFGPLTKAAVLSFQSKNRLIADGIVGILTRAALNNSSVRSDVNTGSIKENTVKSVENKDFNTNTSPSLNSNVTNIDQFIKIVVEVNKKNGFSEKKLNAIADTLRETIANSGVDYNKKFKEVLVNESKLSLDFKKPYSSIFNRIVSKAFSVLGITPSMAQASVKIPFGGALIFPFYCAYNNSWMIGLQPLPPTYAVLLTYYPGTQAFASYNIPFTRYLLGSYVTPGVCVIPATVVPISIPTEGTITPMTGSSPT